MDEEDSHSSLLEASFKDEVVDHGDEEDDDDRFIKMLLHKEIDLNSPSSRYSIQRQSIQCGRSDEITWILRTRSALGFGFLTAYLSVIYLDRFLQIRPMEIEKTWAMRLLSVACFSLAAKMKECWVPRLGMFDAEDYRFQTKVIQRMELLVLNTLEWKMDSITPFSFIHFFASHFCNTPSSNSLMPITAELIMTIIKERNTTDHRSSSIAAAAVLMSMGLKELSKSGVELRINSLPSCQSLETEDVVCCYNLMQEIEFRKVKTPVFFNGSSSGAATFTGDSSKRRRLKLEEYDQNPKLP